MLNFSEYIKKGIVRKVNTNLSRAKDLVKESLNRKSSFLDLIKDKIEIKDDNANYFIEQVYDILIGLIRAKMFVDGFTASGNYAHEAEIAYLKELGFITEEVIFMDELRQFRNGIKYYGKSFKKEEADKTLIFLADIMPKLLNVLKDIL